MYSKLEGSLRKAYKQNYKVELLMKDLEVRSDNILVVVKLSESRSSPGFLKI
jgi:hypothetical protein